MRTFTVSTKPYEFRLYSRKEVSFLPGLTVLVGCNGSGKSTLMMLMQDQLRNDPNALILKYDDRMDGGHNLMEKMGYFGQMDQLAEMFTSSEGERIMTGICCFIPSMRGKIKKSGAKEIWIFLDAVGSGLSIDGIREIKDFVKVLEEDNPDRDIYFIVSTNEYEFAENADCIDVTTFLHVAFTEYGAYRDYILKTRKKKDKRK